MRTEPMSRVQYYLRAKRRVDLSCTCGAGLSLARYPYPVYRGILIAWNLNHGGDGHAPCTVEEARDAFRAKHGDSWGTLVLPERDEHTAP